MNRQISKNRCYDLKDPEGKFARTHISYVLHCCEVGYSPVILDGLKTAKEWYDEWRSEFNNDADAQEKEEQLAEFIAEVMRLRCYWDPDTKKNDAVQHLSEMRQETHCDDVLRDLFRKVHPTQWTALLSRWAWRHGKVFEDWMDNPVCSYVYDDEQQYNDSARAVVENDEAEMARFQSICGRKRPRFTVDPDCVRVLRRFLGFTACNLPKYCYATPELLEAALDSWWKYWVKRHYFNEEDMDQFDDAADSVLDPDSEIYQTRKNVEMHPDRIKYLWNNIHYGHAVSGGTKPLEFVHGYINRFGLGVGKRNAGFAILQAYLLQFGFCEAHHDLMVDRYNELLAKGLPDIWPNDHVKRVQAIYSEMHLMQEWIYGAARDDKRYKLIQIDKNVEGITSAHSQFVKTHQCPTKKMMWSQNEQYLNALLLTFLLSWGRLERERRDRSTVDLDDEIVTEMMAQKVHGTAKHVADWMLKKHSRSLTKKLNIKKAFEADDFARIKDDIINVDRYQYRMDDHVPLEVIRRAKEGLFGNFFTVNTVCSRFALMGYQVPRSWSSTLQFSNFKQI